MAASSRRRSSRMAASKMALMSSLRLNVLSRLSTSGEASASASMSSASAPCCEEVDEGELWERSLKMRSKTAFSVLVIVERLDDWGLGFSKETSGLV